MKSCEHLTKHEIPRICGGVSSTFGASSRTFADSPHLRGCFPKSIAELKAGGRFPASAGVFPTRGGFGRPAQEIPRICGGVSEVELRIDDVGEDSPHLRGCFRSLSHSPPPSVRFPASAGVFPMSAAHSGIPSQIPRICGGVSGSSGRFRGDLRDSPHLRGCFRGAPGRPRFLPRFPASAGVFLRRSNLLIIRRQIPRICGGVSAPVLKTGGPNGSSLHLRGCFRREARTHPIDYEFPASAGVFLLPRGALALSSRVPRICGGVSDTYIIEPGVMASSPHLRGCF